MYKVIVVGNTSVGKTCIVNRFVHGTFERTTPTLSIDSASNKIKINEDIEVRL